jgi:Flp pilus assembly pilin Flp
LATRPVSRESRIAFELWLDDGGATMVEYGIMLALIALVCIVAVQFVGEGANSFFSDPDLVDALGG